jgi:hypothetical protein
MLLATPALAFVPGMKAKVNAQTGAGLASPVQASPKSLEDAAMELQAQKAEFAYNQAQLEQFAPEEVQYVQEQPQMQYVQQQPAVGMVDAAQPENVEGTSSNQWQTALWAALVSLGGVTSALATRQWYKNKAANSAEGYQSVNGGYQAPVMRGNAFATRGNFALAAQPDSVASFPADSPEEPWDPLDLLNQGDGINKGGSSFERLRYVELKHGRISMLAVLGQIVTKAGIRLPGDIDLNGTHFADIDTGIKGIAQVPGAGWAQMILFVGLLELFVMKDSANGAAPGDFPGDFRNGALDYGWDNFDEDTKARKRGIELNNGRAAMMGILALMVHEELGVSLWPGEGVVPGL